MISTFFLTLAGNLYLVLLGLLPSGNLPAGITEAITTITSYMYKMNQLLPIDTLFQVVGAMLVFDGALIVFHAIQWTLRKIPILNIK